MAKGHKGAKRQPDADRAAGEPAGSLEQAAPSIHATPAWGSVSIGLCGRDRLADYAARVLDRRERTIDRVAFHAGLQYLQPRRVWFCSCRSLPYKSGMHQLLEAWGSVSIGLCGRDRLADYAARVLDRRERTIDRVAFSACRAARSGASQPASSHR